jgi:hypothetical protein
MYYPPPPPPLPWYYYGESHHSKRRMPDMPSSDDGPEDLNQTFVSPLLADWLENLYKDPIRRADGLGFASFTDAFKKHKIFRLKQVLDYKAQDLQQLCKMESGVATSLLCYTTHDMEALRKKHKKARRF